MGNLEKICEIIFYVTYIIIFPFFSVIFQHSCISEWWVLLIINMILNIYLFLFIYDYISF
jgi:hypothetical protein